MNNISENCFRGKVKMQFYYEKALVASHEMQIFLPLGKKTDSFYKDVTCNASHTEYF